MFMRNLKCGDYTNDKNIFFAKQISDELRSIRAEITWSHKCVIQLHHPRKVPDSDSFSDFLEKLETSFCTIILILCTTC